MTKSKAGGMDETKRLMGALVRMKPKPHEALKKQKSAPSKGTVSKAGRKKQATK